MLETQDFESANQEKALPWYCFVGECLKKLECVSMYDLVILKCSTRNISLAKMSSSIIVPGWEEFCHAGGKHKNDENTIMCNAREVQLTGLSNDR